MLRGRRLITPPFSTVIVALAVDETIDVGGAEAQKFAELHDRQFRCAAGGMIADPSGGNLEALGDFLGCIQPGGRGCRRRCGCHWNPFFDRDER